MGIPSELNFNLPHLVEMLPKNTKIGIDDLLDATILCWTANRFYKGVGQTLPEKKITKDEFFIYV